MKPPFSTNVWLLFCRLSGKCHNSGLALLFSLLRSAIACIRGARSSSTSYGPCKGGVSVNELMYNVHLFFIIKIANDDHFVKKMSH